MAKLNNEKKNIKNISDELYDLNSKTEINEVTWLTKIIYASTAGPSQMFLSAINVFSTVFLLESAQLSSAKLS